MRVVVTVEGRFSRTPDGAVWTATGQDRRFWTRYLSAFDAVRVVARVADTPAVPAGAKRVTGAGVEVWAVPHYLGPYQYLTRRAALARRTREAATGEDAVILRVPSPIGVILATARDRQRLPYALEVVGDPHDVFAPGVVRHPLRPLLRRWFVDGMRRQCRSAAGVAYVTQRYLQARYPAGPTAVTAAISDVDLVPSAYAAARSTDRTRHAATLVSVGSLEQPYKGIDTLVAALARLVAGGLSPRLVHVGDGRCRPRLEHLARRLGVADRVVITGALPAGAAVRRHLDAADLFVMPSRTEGLPRALVEAMARGLPAIGSTAGGIPELLPPEFVVPPDDPARLAAAVGALLARPELMAAASARNLAWARDFSAESLTGRRAAYYRAVAEATVRRSGNGGRV
jgi:glycosyltransferase involved in cell wall biosynthesis